MNQAHPEQFTLAQAKQLSQPTKDYLCSEEANIYGIEFVYFKIKNNQNNQTLFEVRKPPTQIGKPPNANKPRTIKYQFGPEFFKLKVLSTTLEFSIGPKPVKNFLMMERHYFRNKLIKSFQFSIPFCMPTTVNTLESVYDLPVFDAATQKQMIESPFETVSDSLYFVDGILIMHNKAEYSYAPFGQ